MQKYIKKKKDQMIVSQKVKCIQRAKWLFKQIAKSDMEGKKLQRYKMMKSLLTGSILDICWQGIQQHYLDNM